MSTLTDISPPPPRMVRLRIRGFRSYGTEVRELQLDSPVTVIKGDNSQGKTATAEALEFLFTGSSSRRALVGGAKAEYERMLANVHLAEGDTDVWVEADVRCPDGVVRTVRRALDTDYSSSADCTTSVTIDSVPATDLTVLGIPLGEPPLAAPVLLQHNLRYVLSTEPQKRATYFRALLEIDDLDIVRQAVARAKDRVARLQPLGRVALLAGFPAGTRTAVSNAAKVTNLGALTRNLIALVHALVPSVTSTQADAAIADLRALKTQAEEKVFPIAALTPSVTLLPAGLDITRVDSAIQKYNELLVQVDADVARLTPIFSAVLNHPEFGHLTEPKLCPVCNDGTLRPERIAALHDQISASAGLQDAARDLSAELQRTLQEVDRVGGALKSSLPDAKSWSRDTWAEVSAHRDSLIEGGVPSAPALDSHQSAFGMVVRAAAGLDRLRDLRGQVKNWTTASALCVGERRGIVDGASLLVSQVNDCISDVSREMQTLNDLVGDLQLELGDKLRAAPLPVGMREILQLLEERVDLFRELQIYEQRKAAKQRIEAVGRVVQSAEQALLDARFDTMGAEIDRWWTSLRPDELVRFGGVGRRASGRRYVNLTAELAASADASPQVRDALGVFSDSQLNALGLAAFIARQRLLGSPVLVFDDPLSGYDPEHRVTFAVNTLGALLDDGVQVIICTHDPKLAVNIVEVHRHRGLEQYELSLSDMLEGTAVTNESDVFGRYVLEAQDSIASLSIEGRRNAANALRRAAERLAKQIIATGRTQSGTPTRVSEVGDKVLGDLIPEVLGFALGNDERGRWNLWKHCLNPGAHDDDVPLSPTLKTVLGDIKKLKRSHDAHWTGGLLK